MENIFNIKSKQKITIREVIIEWLRMQIGKIIGTHNIEELRAYMLEQYGVMRTSESLSREFRRLRSEGILKGYGLIVEEVKSESRENKYRITEDVETDLFGNRVA